MSKAHLTKYPLGEEPLDKLLTRLTEECGEVIQAVAKAQRFGLGAKYYNVSNAEAINNELSDVMFVWAELQHRGILP